MGFALDIWILAVTSSNSRGAPNSYKIVLAFGP